MASFEIKSQEHRDLFDIIDKLRSQGVSTYIDLPQIVVCGDQSSGKSSVLEAISGMTFPAKDNLCTRFATELVLRHTSEAEIGLKVSIIPGADRTNDEIARLEDFQPSADLLSLNLGNVVDAAKDVMGLSDTRRFSNDILRVELCGPSQPHLTMVDLPGLFKSANKDQSKADSRTIERMVVKYMSQPRSIILAVVSAKNELVNQQVTDLARRIDASGNRTLGLITKPDTLHRGSESEHFYVNLARNRDIKFRLGWHVLRNRDYPERSSTSAKRNRCEEEFFATGPWAAIDQSNLGVSSLKPKLSELLKDQILQQLGGLQSDIEDTIQSCKADLQLLGPARESISDQRRYLARVSRDFSRLMEAAVRGNYADPFFGDALTEDGFRKRLLAVVRTLLDEFSDEMSENGHNRTIIDELSDNPSERLSVTSLDYPRITITRTELVEEVKTLMKTSRGRELPGLYDPMIIAALFTQHCKPWETITHDYTDRILRATFETIKSILGYVAASETTRGMLRKINSGMEAIQTNLETAIKRLLCPHQVGHPITYNPALVENVANRRAKRRRQRIKNILEEMFRASLTDDQPLSAFTRSREINMHALVEKLDQQLADEMDSNSTSSAIDYMEAYYEVALRRFVDDFSVLAVEKCLMDNLSTLFDRELVDELDDQEVQHLAAQSAEDARLRQRWTEKLSILEPALRELKMRDKHTASGESKTPQASRTSIPASPYSGESVETESESPGSVIGDLDGPSDTDDSVAPIREYVAEI